MLGNFAIGLIEILAYLLPGGVVLASVLIFYQPNLGNSTLKETAYQVAFFVCSYIIGHLLTIISYSYTQVRILLKNTGLVKPPKERLRLFYEPLLAKLRSVFGLEITGDAAYFFSARLITDNKLPASQIVDRYYALTLFSRNISAAFVVVAILSVHYNRVVVILAGSFAILFLLRYLQLERIVNDTVFRAAYVYLCSKKIDETSQGTDAENT